MDQEQAATEVVESPNGTEPKAEQTVATERDRSALFEHSDYLHVGPAADTCPDAVNGKCADATHFHAWVRLPNPFQSTEIRRKAQAAKARRLRQLRDPESDGRTVIDYEVQEFIDQADSTGMIDILVNKDFLQDHLKAMQAVSEEDDFKTIEDDRERLRAMGNMKPEDRNQEEYDELTTHVASFTERVNEERQSIQGPLRQSLEESKSLEELAEMVTQQMIEADAATEFNDAYSKWEWFVCTMKPRGPDKGRPVERMFPSIDGLMGMAPEVHEALDVTFTNLEAAAGRQLKGS